MNGKSYIGKTGVNFGDRWDCHKAQLNGGYHDNRYLQNAWNKYGADNFEFKIIEEVKDVDRLNDLEIKYIKEYKDKDLSYNLHDGGDGGYNLGKHLSDDTKRKIGEKNRINMLGRTASEETKKKMSASQLARYDQWTDKERSEWGQLTSEWASGYHWSEESKQKFSQKQRTSPNAAKYTPDDIRTIRKRYNEGCSKDELAEAYNTSAAYIQSIISKRRWKYID